MAFLIKALVFIVIFLWTAADNFPRLWKGGLVGTGVMLVVDTLGNLFNLYHYKSNFAMLGGYMPLTHIPDIFFTTMLFLNWIPRQWPRKLLYIICASVIFLAVEAVMFQAGALVYLKWRFWYSFFLDIAGLSLTAYLSDLIISKKLRLST